MKEVKYICNLCHCPFLPEDGHGFGLEGGHAAFELCPADKSEDHICGKCLKQLRRKNMQPSQVEAMEQPPHIAESEERKK